MKLSTREKISIAAIKRNLATRLPAGVAPLQGNLARLWKRVRGRKSRDEAKARESAAKKPKKSKETAR